MLIQPFQLVKSVIFTIITIFSNSAYSYANTAGSDYVIDAPWRTIREYVPVLFFAPETKNQKITKLELRMFDVNSNVAGALIYSDDPQGPDKTTCSGGGRTHDIEILDHDGFIGTTLPSGNVEDQWHYIARIPTACLGVRGVKHLIGTILTTDGEKNTKVLRVVVDPQNPLPKFSPLDHHFDIHYHTIAEQTHGSIMDIDNAYKAFGGPLTMLLESAYAIGMVDINMKNGNWPDFINQISTTDHNSFYSNTTYDQGGAPGFGPTRSASGQSEEFNWYRSNFGELGGEEITLQGTGRIDASGQPAFGSHLLSYGSPHIEGPWHGGEIKVANIVNQRIKKQLNEVIKYGDLASIVLLGIPFGGYLTVEAFNDSLEEIPSGEKNPLQLNEVLSVMGNTNGFGYAAHPFSKSLGWPKDYFNKALGWGGGRGWTTTKNSPPVSSTGEDFVYKGSQVWNGKEDYASADINEKISKKLNPFGDDPTQKFEEKQEWNKKLEKESTGMADYLEHVSGGLRFSFSDKPDHKFIRKVYMSAGTDAHGDFNYSTNVAATIILEVLEQKLKIPVTPTSISINEFASKLDKEINIISLNSNAFGRVRTYALAADRRIRAGESTWKPPTSEAIAEGLIADSGIGSGGTTRRSNLAVQAYRDGNTVLTDGPICIFHVDANCRFNSDGKQLKWHDSTCKFENFDGAIGGNGKFDGARTVLVPRVLNQSDPAEVWVQTKWKGRNDYIYSPEETSTMSLDILKVRRGENNKVIPVDEGTESELSQSPLDHYSSRNLDYSPSALLLRGHKGTGEKSSMCLTNPIWTVPYNIYITSPTKCPIAPNELKVSVSFGISMETTIKDLDRCSTSASCAFDSTLSTNSPYKGARISIYALDKNGNSVGEPQYLNNREWSPMHLAGPNFKKINDAKFYATNSKTIECPKSRWNAETHSSTTEERIVSYAVVVSDLRDMNYNYLNSIGKSFSVENPSLALIPDLDARDPGPGTIAPGRDTRDPDPEPEPDTRIPERDTSRDGGVLAPQN